MRSVGGIRIPDKDTYKIMSTYRYDDFRFVEGNRDIDHADRIKESMMKSGLLIQPVLCNEKMEIIEGQNRYTACRELGLPVYYVIQDGIGLDEVKSLNSASKNWTTKNYVHSYAAGDKQLDYIFIEQLMRAYPWATNRVLGFAVHEFIGGTYGTMKSGTFKCSELEYNRAVSVLDYVNQFRENVNGIGGRKEFYIMALMFCFFCEEVDNEYLYAKFNKYYKSLSPISDIKSAVLQIESKVYNYQMRSPREPISIVMEFERAKRSSRNSKRKED